MIIIRFDSYVRLTPFSHVKKEVSTQEGSTIGIDDEQVYGHDASGTGDAVQVDNSEPTSGNTQKASTIGIEEPVYADSRRLHFDSIGGSEARTDSVNLSIEERQTRYIMALYNFFAALALGFIGADVAYLVGNHVRAFVRAKREESASADVTVPDERKGAGDV